MTVPDAPKPPGASAGGDAGTSAEASEGHNSLLARRFVSLADTLVDDFDVVDLMDQLVEACLELLGADAAGLLLADQRGALQLVASSSEQTRLLELLQLQNDEGPCLDCVRTGRAVEVPDLAGVAGRWPRFAAAAESVGFVAVYALPMRLRDQTVGGLNLFCAKPAALGSEDQRLAQALADMATIGLLQQRSRSRAHQVAEQLQAALESRVAIEQAKGVLAEYGGLDMGGAFQALRRFARDGNHKLSEVAEHVVRRTVPLDRVIAASQDWPRS